MTTLVPVRTKTYSHGYRLGNGKYIHLADYKEATLPDPIYYTCVYFVTALSPFNRIATMLHELSPDAAPVLVNPWKMWAVRNAAVTSAAVVAAAHAGPTVRRLLRRALLMRLLCKLWRARQARRSRAAAVIQQAWADAWYTPSRAICKRRIHREWQAMVAGN
jgi:hypothetical protein